MNKFVASCCYHNIIKDREADGSNIFADDIGCNLQILHTAIEELEYRFGAIYVGNSDSVQILFTCFLHCNGEAGSHYIDARVKETLNTDVNYTTEIVHTVSHGPMPIGRHIVNFCFNNNTNSVSDNNAIFHYVITNLVAKTHKNQIVRRKGSYLSSWYELGEFEICESNYINYSIKVQINFNYQSDERTLKYKDCIFIIENEPVLGDSAIYKNCFISKYYGGKIEGLDVINIPKECDIKLPNIFWCYNEKYTTKSEKRIPIICLVVVSYEM